MKILMAGLGSMGQRHLRNILSILGDDTEIIAYRVRKEQDVFTDQLGVEEGVELKKKYNFISYENLDDALNEGPEAVFICNPTSLHMPVALSAAKKGCHLFIEKPLSHNLDGIEELYSIVKETNLITYIGFQLRFHPIVIKLKQLVKEQRVGNLLSVYMEVGEYMPGWHKWEDYRRMYASKKELGGGVVLTQIHEIDYAMDIFGLPQSVYALGGHFSSLEIDVEDSADILMEIPCHKRLLPVYIHMDFLQRPPSRKCRVIGENGTITMDFVSQSVTVIDTDGNEEKFDHSNFQRNDLFLNELKHFFACIRDNDDSSVDIKTAFNGMKIVLAIKESMKQGEKVLLNF